MQRLMFLILMALYVPIRSDAQRSYRKYNTQQVMEQLKKEQSNYAANLDNMEAIIAKMKPDLSDKVHQIPVLFHILMSPDTKNFPDKTQVKEQLDSLNVAFAIFKKKYKEYPNDKADEFSKKGINAGLSFCLPEKVGLKGSQIAGINIVKTDVKTWALGSDVKDPKKGGVAPYDPAHYVNIWIAELGEYNAGFALLPGANASIDGIVIDPDYFGGKKGASKKPYDEGITLVHLMAGYLGLYELWNENRYCADDFVSDTPIHNAPNDDVIIEKNSQHISMCTGNPVEMYMNFMDNTDDKLQEMFTPLQKERLRKMLSTGGPRYSLVNGEVSCGKIDVFITSKQLRINDNQLLLYPNPTSSEVIVDMTSTQSGEANISIINSLGARIQEQVYAMEKGVQKLNLDCANLPEGLYFIQVKFADKSLITKNLSIQR
jgi:Secretion system C-terminal sorting domain